MDATRITMRTTYIYRIHWMRGRFLIAISTKILNVTMLEIARIM
jgi:hypothetical protein